MKKTLQITLLVFALVFLSGCAQKDAKNQNTIANPITDPVGNTKDMVNLKNNMQKNIQDATNKENENRDKTLDLINDNKASGVGDNSELVKRYMYATIKTNLGDIKVKLNGTTTPVTVGNFLKLAKSDFYANTKFHRVIKGFMIQGGDPLSKDESKKSAWGTGGPGYKFDDELTGQEKYPQGTLAMANAGPNTNGSQFFIVTVAPGAPLPPSYTVFGQVVSGLDVALKIENVKTEPGDRPVDDVVIKGIEISEK